MVAAADVGINVAERLFPPAPVANSNGSVDALFLLSVPFTYAVDGSAGIFSTIEDTDAGVVLFNVMILAPVVSTPLFAVLKLSLPTSSEDSKLTPDALFIRIVSC